jgi:hypothetical protein
MLCFFNLAGAVYDPDEEGYELANLGEARVLAAKVVAEIIRDKPDLVWKGEEVRLEVTDAQQMQLFTIVVLGLDAPAMAGQPDSFRNGS